MQSVGSPSRRTRVPSPPARVVRHDAAGAALRHLRPHFATVHTDSWLYSPFLLELFGLGGVTRAVEGQVRTARAAVTAVDAHAWDELMAGYTSTFLRLGLLGPRATAPPEQLLFGFSRHPGHIRRDYYVQEREQIIFLDPVGAAMGPYRN